MVNAVDARQSTAPWYAPWRYTGPVTNFFRGDVSITDIASMVANVIAHLRGRRMNRLNIMDHGNEDGVEIGSDWLGSAADVARFAPVLGRLRGHFASNAIVHMQNCEAGQNQVAICALAAAFGVPVYAGTGLQNRCSVSTLATTSIARRAAASIPTPAGHPTRKLQRLTPWRDARRRTAFTRQARHLMSC